jgi:hypothetical protein
MYVIPLLYRIISTSDHISVSRLLHAFQAVITKNNILRTAIYLDTNGTVVQRCLDASVMNHDSKLYGFSVINLRNRDNDEGHHNIDKTINDIINHTDLFDLSKGRVIHCHILRHCRPDDDLLFENDLILFNIHHSIFDGASTSIFLRDLSRAYEMDCSLSLNDNILQYIDYAVHERLMDITLSREFWKSELEGYDLERPLSLPVDRQRSSTDQRSGLASVAEISFDDDTSTAFLNYASSHHIPPFQLGLATFYAFLFKLTYGQSDLCISGVNANRYRTELENMIGMFVSTLPHRIQLHSHWTFDELVKHVQQKCLSIFEHSHYPLQHILADFHANQSNASFLETMFDFITISSNIDQFSLHGASLEQVSLPQSSEVAKYDFMLRFVYDSRLNDGKLSCSFVCSRDLFEETTVVTIAKRFQHLLFELFSSNTRAVHIDKLITPINKLSIILLEEAEEMQGIVFHRLSSIVNQGM